MALPKPSFVVTPYGDVDAHQLEALRVTFNTADLFALVDQIDDFCRRLAPVGGLRDDVLRLHGMAHTVINGEGLTQPTDEMDLWETAEDLMNEFRVLAEGCLHAAELLQPLADLNPNHED